MRKTILILGLGLTGAVHAATVFDNTGFANGTTFRSAEDAPALTITNTNADAVLLSRVSFLGRSSQSQNFKFFLATSTGTVLDSTVVSVLPTPTEVLIGTDVNWTLAAGQSYHIGAISESGPAEYAYQFPGFNLQNGLQSSANANYVGFTTPTFDYVASADMAWKLEGSVVPEPGTLLAIGAGIAGIAARRRRKLS